MFCIFLHRFAFQVAIGGKNTKETKSNRTICFLGVSCSCHSAAGFGRSLGGQQDPEKSHSCSTLGVNWVPGLQDGGRDEERSRRRFPIYFGRRRKGS